MDRTPDATPDDDVEAFTHAFLRAFEDLDLPRFIACFADDASAFFPAPEPPRRVDSRAAIERRFAQVFAAIRAGAGGGPPWHRLEAQALRTRRLAPGVALVTFELHNPERLARRTLVLQHRDDGWRIAHLHASNGAPDHAE